MALEKIKNIIHNDFLSAEPKYFGSKDLITLFFFDVYFRCKMQKNIDCNFYSDEFYSEEINIYIDYLQKNISAHPNELTKLMIYSANYIRHTGDYEKALSLINQTEKQIKEFMLDNLFPTFYIAKIICLFNLCEYKEVALLSKEIISLLLTQGKKERINHAIRVIDDLRKRSQVYAEYLKEINYFDLLCENGIATLI